MTPKDPPQKPSAPKPEVEQDTLVMKKPVVHSGKGGKPGTVGSAALPLEPPPSNAEQIKVLRKQIKELETSLGYMGKVHPQREEMENQLSHLKRMLHGLGG